VWVLTLFLLVLYPLDAQQSEFKGTFKEEKVVMRDGVKLATNVFVPEGPGPWPVVLTRTPYGMGGSSNRESAVMYAARGYARIIQDCRGTGRSEGTQKIPFLTDGPDGYDTIEWIAKQPWSNGKIGIVGRSGYGITATLAATQAPPHLLCAFTMFTSADFRRDAFHMGGVYRKDVADGWMYAHGKGNQIAEIVARPISDPYWDWLDIVKQHPKIQIPIYNVGGWYDIFAQGNIDNFVGLQKNGGGKAAGNQKLLMAPTGHVTLREQIEYPENAKFDPQDIQLRWLDFWLKGVQNGIMNEPAVRYYVMGDPKDPAAPGNEWRTSASWPPASKITAYFLRAQGKLDTAPPDARESSEEYRYDPRNTVPTVGGQNLMIGQGPKDQRAIAARQDYLRFETPVLAKPVEVTGRVYVDLWIETDAPDTDFMAKLVDVYPDGYEALVLDAPIRVRYREGLDKEVFMKPGEVVRARIDLWSTSLVFNKGHKIAVHVTSSNNPRFDPNPNTGKRLRLDSETRVAVNRVHHDAAHPSRILLPIVRIYEPKKPS
jgi:hypothetical protein